MKQEYAHSTKENLIESLPSLTSGQSRSLVMAGDDAHLSRKAIRKMITKFIEKKLFSSYWYEGKDVEWNDVNTIPMGFILSYIENSGYANVYQAVLKSDQNPKTKLLLAAWGAVWKGMFAFVLCVPKAGISCMRYALGMHIMHHVTLFSET
jgi:hypothetical protein